MAGTVSTGALAILCLQWITSGFWTELHEIPVPSTRIAYSYKAESQTLLSKERTKPAVELSMMLWQWFALKQQKSLLKPTKAKKKKQGKEVRVVVSFDFSRNRSWFSCLQCWLPKLSDRRKAEIYTRTRDGDWDRMHSHLAMLQNSLLF